MRILLIKLVLAVLCASAAATEVVFEGPPPADRDRLVSLASRQMHPDTLRAVLIDEGYLDAVVSSDSVKVTVNAGPPYMLDRIIWLHDSSESTFANRVFSRRNLEEIINDHLKSFQGRGHLYASAAVVGVDRSGADVTIRVRLSPGPLLTLERSLFTGLVRTSAGLVERYLPLEKGDTLTELSLSRAERAAAAIPFVVYRPPAVIRPLPGYTAADVEFAFDEKKQVVVAGGGGYTPAASSRVAWNLNLAFQNLFGQGKQVRLHSERRETGRQVLDISYSQPLFLISVGTLSGRVATRDYRDRFYEFALGGAYETSITRDFTAALSLGWRSVEPSGDAPSYSSFAAAVTAARNSLDNQLNPSSGLVLEWTVEFSYRRYAADSPALSPERGSFNETRNRVSFGWYRSLVARLVGYVGLSYVGLETGESLPPLSELYYLGGPGTIRGYRNEQFVAVRSARGSLEPRWRVDGGYLFLFYDGAYINNRVPGIADGVITDEFYRSGYGFGAAVIERSRSVKISLGWNPETSFDQPQLSLEFSSEI